LTKRVVRFGQVFLVSGPEHAGKNKCFVFFLSSFRLVSMNEVGFADRSEARA